MSGKALHILIPIETRASLCDARDESQSRFQRLKSPVCVTEKVWQNEHSVLGLLVRVLFARHTPDGVERVRK
jgi:hypothetical protein